MTIGIDISPLQTAHRMRGIGSVVVNFINNIPQDEKNKHSFIFFMDSDGESKKQALALLHLDGVNYEVRYKAQKKGAISSLPSRLGLIFKLLKKLVTLLGFLFGSNSYNGDGLNVFLLTDQVQIMPRMRGVKKYMIAYDLIPYIIEWDYLRSYRTIRRVGLSRKAALASQLARYVYITKVRINVKKSHKVLAISEQTRKDFIKYAGVSKRKIAKIVLGINPPTKDTAQKEPTEKFVSTSWGYVLRQFKFDTDTPFLLFVGGTDARRKLDDLVTAFNHLRAEGHNLNLVLSGDILQGPNNLPVKESREALANSSYSEDIIYLGFTGENVKNWLYKHALAFVYPSRYEGFGLPVLEAMCYGTPVITYKNSSISEISGQAVIYANNAPSIKEAAEKLLNDPAMIKKYSQLGKKQASKFSWKDSVKRIISSLEA